MVFGWGKKKEPPPVIAPVRVRLEETAGIADDVMAKRSQNMVTEAANKLHDTNRLIRELAKIRRDLERDDLDLDDVDKRVRPLAIRGKKMLVGALKSNATELEPIRSSEDIAGTAGELEHRLKRLGNMLGKQSRVIHFFAERYAARLRQILEEMEANRKFILQVSNRHQADETLAKTVTNGADNIRALEESVRENAQKKSDAETEVQRIDNRAARLESDIQDYRASAKHTRLLDLRRRLQDMQETKAKLASEISIRFTAISRPLSRYRWVSSDKEQTALLQRMQQSPYTVMNHDDEKAVVALLQNILGAVKAESISVKDVDKASEAMDGIIGSISGYVKRVEEAEADLAKTKTMMHDAEPVRLREMEDELAKLQESKDLEVRKAAQTAAAATLSAQSIPIEIVNVRDALLRLTGTKYEIEYRGPDPS